MAAFCGYWTAPLRKDHTRPDAAAKDQRPLLASRIQLLSVRNRTITIFDMERLKEEAAID